MIIALATALLAALPITAGNAYDTGAVQGKKAEFERKVNCAGVHSQPGIVTIENKRGAVEVHGGGRCGDMWIMRIGARDFQGGRVWQVCHPKGAEEPVYSWRHYFHGGHEFMIYMLELPRTDVNWECYFGTSGNPPHGVDFALMWGFSETSEEY